jgi:hypothetical protein
MIEQHEIHLKAVINSSSTSGTCRVALFRNLMKVIGNVMHVYLQIGM